MIKHVVRIMLCAIVASTVSLGGLVAASSVAVAAPGGIFSVFADCPLAAFRALGVKPTLCGYRQVTSGELTIGFMSVPIDQTITLQGGFVWTGNPEVEREFFAYPAEGGETVSKTELEVPGGLAGLIDCREIEGGGFREKLERDRCKASSLYGRVGGATATIESVANAENPSIFNEYASGAEEGTGLVFPIRVHLKNPFLGNSCFIGSEASPLQLHLTTGATGPPEGFHSIHGALGEPKTVAEGKLWLLRVSGSSYVDNTFTAPGAEGCGESASSIVDPLLDSKLGLPSQAGHNAIVLTGTAEATTAETVEASEKQQAEAEAKKQQEEAEAKKKQEETEAKKKQEETEAKKKQEEAEAKRRHEGHHRRHWRQSRRHSHR